MFDGGDIDKQMISALRSFPCESREVICATAPDSSGGKLSGGTFTDFKPFFILPLSVRCQSEKKTFDLIADLNLFMKKMLGQFLITVENHIGTRIYQFFLVERGC